MNELSSFLCGSHPETLYSGILMKAGTTRQQIREKNGRIVGARAQFSILQLILWELVAYQSVAAGKFDYTFHDTGGWNCQTWTAAAALLAADVISKIKRF